MMKNAFNQVRVFNPFAPSNHPGALLPHTSSIIAEEKSMQTADLKHGTWLLYTHCSVSNRKDGQCAQVTYKRLVSMLAAKRDQPYSQVMNVVRYMLYFSLLKS